MTLTVYKDGRVIEPARVHTLVGNIVNIQAQPDSPKGLDGAWAFLSLLVARP